MSELAFAGGYTGGLPTSGYTITGDNAVRAMYQSAKSKVYDFAQKHNLFRYGRRKVSEPILKADNLTRGSIIEYTNANGKLDTAEIPNIVLGSYQPPRTEDGKPILTIEEALVPGETGLLKRLKLIKNLKKLEYIDNLLKDKYDEKSLYLKEYTEYGIKATKGFLDELHNPEKLKFMREYTPLHETVHYLQDQLGLLRHNLYLGVRNIEGHCVKLAEAINEKYAVAKGHPYYQMGRNVIKKVGNIVNATLGLSKLSSDLQGEIPKGSAAVVDIGNGVQPEFA